MSLCTAEDVANWIDISGRPATLVEAALGAAEEFINDETEDQFTPENSVAKSFDGNGKKLLLTRPSLRAVTKIEIIDKITGSIDLLDKDEYLWDKGWVKLRGNYSYWPVGKSNIKVTGSWGWTQVPSMVRLLAAQVAALMLGTPKDGVKSESLGSYSVTYSDGSEGSGLTVQDVINKYRLHKIFMGTPLRRPRVLMSLTGRDEEESARLHDPNP